MRIRQAEEYIKQAAMPRPLAWGLGGAGLGAGLSLLGSEFIGDSATDDPKELASKRRQRRMNALLTGAGVGGLAGGAAGLLDWTVPKPTTKPPGPEEPSAWNELVTKNTKDYVDSVDGKQDPATGALDAITGKAPIVNPLDPINFVENTVPQERAAVAMGAGAGAYGIGKGSQIAFNRLPISVQNWAMQSSGGNPSSRATIHALSELDTFITNSFIAKGVNPAQASAQAKAIMTDPVKVNEHLKALTKHKQMQQWFMRLYKGSRFVSAPLLKRVGLLLGLGGAGYGAYNYYNQK